MSYGVFCLQRRECGEGHASTHSPFPQYDIICGMEETRLLLYGVADHAQDCKKNCVKTVCGRIYAALVVTCSMVLSVVLLLEVFDGMLFDRFRNSANQILSSKVADSNVNELVYLSGECLSLTDWRYCILKLKMDMWALYSSIGGEISRHYSIYYHAIVVSAAFLVFWVMLSTLNRKKKLSRIFSKRMIIDVIVLFWGGGVVCAVTFLPRPSVLAKIKQEGRFLSRPTMSFETPRFRCAGYVVVADSPWGEHWRAVPMLGESYGDYLKRREEPAGMHKSPAPGRKEKTEWARDFMLKKDSGELRGEKFR